MPTPAETYESFMVPVLFRPMAEELLRLARPSAGDRVLDIGCGTGIVARLASPHVNPGGTVTGIDPTEPMLDVAQSQCANEGVNIDWQLGSAEALPFADASFDLAVTQSAFMFFDNHSQALDQMRRVLAGDGELAISVFQSIELHPFYLALHEQIELLLGNSGVADIFSMGAVDALKTLIEQAGFADVRVESREIISDFGSPQEFIAGEIDVDTASIPAMQHLNQAESQELKSTLRDLVAEPLDRVTVDGHVQMPFHYLVALAHRE